MGKVRYAADHLIEEWFEVFQLDEKSPSGLSWKINGNNKVKGKPCGWLSDLGYWKVEYKTKTISCHRVVYYLLYSSIEAEKVVDHINGIPSDNTPSNLRLITYAENCRNKKRSKNNRTGLTGVYENHEFIAVWSENGKSYSKTFKVADYGEDTKAVAEEFRENKIAELNAKGYNYSDTHGLQRD